MEFIGIRRQPSRVSAGLAAPLRRPFITFSILLKVAPFPSFKNTSSSPTVPGKINIMCATAPAGAVVANYPWDGSMDGRTHYAGTPDDATFRHLAGVYAKAHPFMSKSKASASRAVDWMADVVCG